MSDRYIEFRNIHKAFGDHQVLKGVDLCVKKGETMVILGASGSGKSVLINALISYVVLAIGTWLWFWFSQPTNVSIGWFFILLLLAFGLLSPLLMGRFNFNVGASRSPAIMGVTVFALVFFLNKFLVIQKKVAYLFLLTVEFFIQ